MVKGGKLFHDREFGDRRDSNPVTSATIRPDGVLDIVIKYDSLSQTREMLFLKASDGRVRSISNKNLDTGEYTIKDGKFTANGNASPWQTRCR